MKKIALTAFLTFLAIFVTDFLIHGVMLKGLYQETASLWRPEKQMNEYMGWMICGQALIALFFTWIFSFGYKGKGWMEGVRYGLLMGGFQAGGTMIMYAVAPYPKSILYAWVFLGLAQAAIVGALLALVYAKLSKAR